jgi:inner membrane protein YidH
MPPQSDPRVFFAAERTLLAWQRSSIALMGLGFVIERFSLFLSLLRRTPENPGHHVFSALVGVLLILIGAAVAFTSSISYRRFVQSLPSDAVPPSSSPGFGSMINIAIAVTGLAVAAYLLWGAFRPP